MMDRRLLTKLSQCAWKVLNLYLTQAVPYGDAKTAAYFSSDCFGTLMSEPVENAADIGSKDLQEGLITWSKVDFPWLHMIDGPLFTKTLNRVHEMSPKIILSGHLSAAHNMTDELLQYLATVPAEEPFVGADQQALESMLEEMT